MTRDCHAGICGSRRVRLPPATQQLIFFLPPDDDDDLEKLSVLKLRVRFSNEMSTRCPIGHCDTAPMRHTFRNECNEANLEPVSDTPTTCPVRFPLHRRVRVSAGGRPSGVVTFLFTDIEGSTRRPERLGRARRRDLADG